MMPNLKNRITLESHPLLPSGEWEGFYCYYNNRQQHKMATNLRFINSSITGSGTDDIAPFSWRGSYDLEAFKLNIRKMYSTHQFTYRGDIDENGIWGIWESYHEANSYLSRIPFRMKGGFHLWPKQIGAESNAIAIEEKESSEKLLEIFIEEFS